MVDEGALLQGDLLFTELRPVSPPWLELCSGADRPLALDGLELRLGAVSLRLPPGRLPARGCVSLCAFTGCGVEVPLPELDPRAGHVRLIGDALIDSVDWTGWQDPGSGSWSLDPSVGTPGANDSASRWCLADPGTPAAVNPDCGV